MLLASWLMSRGRLLERFGIPARCQIPRWKASGIRRGRDFDGFKLRHYRFSRFGRNPTRTKLSLPEIANVVDRHTDAEHYRRETCTTPRRRASDPGGGTGTSEFNECYLRLVIDPDLASFMVPRLPEAIGRYLGAGMGGGLLTRDSGRLRCQRLRNSEKPSGNRGSVDVGRTPSTHSTPKGTRRSPPKHTKNRRAASGHRTIHRISHQNCRASLTPGPL